MLSLCNLFTELYKERQESDRQQGLPKNFLPLGACHFSGAALKIEEKYWSNLYSLAESGCP
jgi:hypothetical protein